jgi:hypothetical protein
MTRKSEESSQRGIEEVCCNQVNDAEEKIGRRENQPRPDGMCSGEGDHPRPRSEVIPAASQSLDLEAELGRDAAEATDALLGGEGLDLEGIALARLAAGALGEALDDGPGAAGAALVGDAVDAPPGALVGARGALRVGDRSVGGAGARARARTGARTGASAAGGSGRGGGRLGGQGGGVGGGRGDEDATSSRW